MIRAIMNFVYNHPILTTMILYAVASSQMESKQEDKHHEP